MSLGSLAAYAPDSDSEHDDGRFSGSDDELHARTKHPRLAELAAEQPDSRPSSVTSQSSRPDSKKLSRLVSYAPDDQATDDEEEEMDLVQSGSEETPISEPLPAEKTPPRNEPHRMTDGVVLPPEPPGRCSRHLQEKINKFYDKMRNGQDLNRKIQDRKDFRNPSIYEKLILFCGIDEKGTNYPPEVYNPKIFGKESFYDELAKVQKVEMDKREKERKEKTKIEFVTGTKRPGSAQGQIIPERKSKWDALPTGQRSGSSAGLPAAAVGKPTVISAVGTIKKK